MSISRTRPTASHRLSRRSGLTVLELVSSLALFVIILGALLVALNSATDMWTLSADKNRTLQKSRQALDRIATDLACAVAPQSQEILDASQTSSTLGTADPWLFDVEGNAKQVGLYFIRALSPSELTDFKQVSLAFVAYSWTTNGLSRYTRPVQTKITRTVAPDLVQQLKQFKADVIAITVPSNILSSAIVGFSPCFYQPLKTPSATLYTQPKYIGQGSAAIDEISLADLPDFVDIHIAFVNSADWSNGFCRTNYLTRRITLPAAQASRLP